MAKRKSGIKTAVQQNKDAVISFDSPQGIQEYTKALHAASSNVVHRASADRNGRGDYSGLSTYVDGKPGFTSKDFDWFRPGQAAPTKSKDIIAFSRYVYRRVGLVRNITDLMGDFTSQGVRLSHRNPAIEKFYQEWFFAVNGKHVTERLAHLLVREANVPLRVYTAKINKNKRKDMQRSVAAESSNDVDLDIENEFYKKNEIPWKYSFIDPLLVEPVGGCLSTLTDNPTLVLKIPQHIKNMVEAIKESDNPDVRSTLDEISPDILAAVESGKDIILPRNKTYMFYYKKDDFSPWADPMSYASYEPLNLYQRLQLADKAAADGAMSKIRVWKIGNLEYKLAPTEVASNALSEMLGANVGGGTIDIIWGPDIELLETKTDLESFLGPEKYEATLAAIYAGYGIPPTLTGSGGGTTNNFISLKTLTERLNYIRDIIIRFWTEQIRVIQKAMGFRYPAVVEFDYMNLEDPASLNTLLLNMADRNILSDEFVQRKLKAIPELENKKIERERNKRESAGVDKVSPYHQVDKEHNLHKIALQNGLVAPSEIGLELEEKKAGEKSLMDHKTQQLKMSKVKEKDTKVAGPNGRPKNKKDTAPRKSPTFKPKLKASATIWAKTAQTKIADILNPIALEIYNKKNIRSLTETEYKTVEAMKFFILCNTKVGQEIDEPFVLTLFSSFKADTAINDEFKEWVLDAEKLNGKPLTVDQVRDLQISYYILKIEN